MPSDDHLHDVSLRFDFPDGPRLFSQPVAILEAHEPGDVEPVFRAVDRERARGRFVAGFVSYEAAPAFDQALAAHRATPGLPLVWFGVFDRAGDGSDETPPDDGLAPEDPGWAPDVDADRFTRHVDTVREAIANGDVYQVNYTFRLEAATTPRTVTDLYSHLCRAHQSPYSAMLSLGRWHIVSLSPELFFRLDAEVIRSRPMKGTTPRGLWPEDDHVQASRLAASDKDRAENVMIVDLVRNDLARIATVGSVRATSLFDVERYPTIWQMTSTVEGRVRPGTSSFDIFAALFPAGSITGAPKSAATQLIRDLEPSPRGVYTGAIGYFAPVGHAEFNVAIRTATIDAESGRMTAGVGGGITWESTADGEHAEAMAKSSFLRLPAPFELIETMRLDRGRFVRLERHLARLAASAAFLDFHCDLHALRTQLSEVQRAHESGVHRVRLLLGRFGSSRVEVAPMPETPEGPRVCLAERAVSSRDRSLFHKTTARQVYERARAARPGCFDVLLWNERREVTEFTIGNVVVELDGTRWTPPRTCGLLAGVFRDELLDSGAIAERVITIDDIGAARRIWLINSLREWVEVRLTNPTDL